MIAKAAAKGATAAGALLALYFAFVGLISGWAFAVDQFSTFWYFIIALAAGFGIQVGLYSYLKNAVGRDPSGKVIAVSGATSTVAMISCCAHYLANILPIIAATGLATFVGQYQIELFWVGLALNLAGIVFIASRVIKFKKGI